MTLTEKSPFEESDFRHFCLSRNSSFSLFLDLKGIDEQLLVRDEFITRKRKFLDPQPPEHPLSKVTPLYRTKDELVEKRRESTRKHIEMVSKRFEEQSKLHQSLEQQPPSLKPELS